MKKSLIKIICFSIAVLPAAAKADYNCTVKINSALVYNDGSVMVNHSGRNDVTMICNMNTQWNGVTPATCALWANTVQGIKRANGNATFYYSGAGTCATMATYGSAPAPVYIAYVP